MHESERRTREREAVRNGKRRDGAMTCVPSPDQHRENGARGGNGKRIYSTPLNRRHRIAPGAARRRKEARTAEPRTCGPSGRSGTSTSVCRRGEAPGCESPPVNLPAECPPLGEGIIGWRARRGLRLWSLREARHETEAQVLPGQGPLKCASIGAVLAQFEMGRSLLAKR
jgi:hypothetical protein